MFNSFLYCCLCLLRGLIFILYLHLCFLVFVHLYLLNLSNRTLFSLLYLLHILLCLVIGIFFLVHMYILCPSLVSCCRFLFALTTVTHLCQPPLFSIRSTVRSPLSVLRSVLSVLYSMLSIVCSSLSVLHTPSSIFHPPLSSLYVAFLSTLPFPLCHPLYPVTYCSLSH